MTSRQSSDKVSVIIPTYNSEQTLRRAIDSVLSQTHTNLELIIVDDASTDGTDDLVNQLSDERIKYSQHKSNQGASAARNLGIKLASGDYIAFLDADDEWHHSKLSLQVSVIKSAPSTVIGVHCGRVNQGGLVSRIREKLSALIGIEDTSVKKEGGVEVAAEVLMLNIKTGTSTYLFKKEAIDVIGGFDPTFKRHQDWEFFLRATLQGEVRYVDDELVYKHETGRPNPSIFDESKKKLFEKFADEIESLNNQGYNIVRRQQFHLAKIYLEDGSFKKSLNNVCLSSLSASEWLSLVWSAGVGFQTNLKRRISKFNNCD